MERRTARREAELERVLSESRQQSKLELSRLRALHADEMGAKDALVHGFRVELDGLLRAAGSLMSGGAGAAERGGEGGGAAERGPTAAAAAPPVWGLVS